MSDQLPDPNRTAKPTIARYAPILAVALVLAVGAFFALRDSGEPVTSGPTLEDHRFLLDTVVSLRIYDGRNTENLDNAFRLIESLESRLSRHKAESEVSAVNRAAAGVPVEVSGDVFRLVNVALEYARLTGGAFDPTVGPLVDLWDISGDDPAVPEAREIEAILPLVDYSGIRTDSGDYTVSLDRPGMSLDLGGIAKGWIADQVVAHLKEAGERHILVNLGGNVVVSGGKPDGAAFRIGMQDPFDDRGSYLGVFSLHDGSVVSSGVYERFFEVDGIRYHHILDTETGYPVRNGLAAVTVLSSRSVDGDALSTALFALGVDQGLVLTASLDGIEAAFVTDDGKVVMTPGAADRFELTNDGVEVEVRSGG